MNKHLDTLELPKILARLAHYTAFPASEALALALRPTPHLAEAQERQAETREAYNLLAERPNTTIGQAHDVRPMAERAERGIILPPPELLQIRQTLIAARDIQRLVDRLADSYPRLADIAARMEPCTGLINAIGEALDEHGEVRTKASPALARIRRELDTAHNRLMEKLNRFISSSQYTRFLQESLITQRAGRYVVPLKAEFKGRIEGIIHDQSASGATLFIEPLTTVELNNRWRKLQMDEQDEINRILAELSALAAQHRRFITHTVAALAALDLALAKARYAEAIEAVEPHLVEPTADQAPQSTPPFSLLAARHPLLHPDEVVPIDVSLPPQTWLLVITGPNTGGKTVSLKTVGLLAAMAQAGLHIPAAEGSSLPVFRHILADIGDEQSIEQSLSTFSSHMTNIVQILQQSDHRCLVILDELGAGTDPVEGSALARSILSYLLERQVHTFVATHYSELKAYAHATPGVANASMQFDVDSLAPTFHLRIGLPGASNAFAIAHRLGLADEIIDRARGLVGRDAQQVEVMLAEIKTELEKARQVHREARQERETAQAERAALKERLAEAEAEKRDILNSARADARREIKAVRQEIRRLKEEAQQRLTVEQAEAEPPEAEVAAAETRLDELATSVETVQEPAPEKKEPSPGGPIRPGDTVLLKEMGATGQVIEIHNGQAEVQLGHFRTTTPLAELALEARAAPAEEEPEPSISLPNIESPGMELDLRGQVAADALLKLEQYLDQAFMARLPWVRIIHGKGGGVLRQAVRQELSGHSLVASFRPGQVGEGGEGVTVAKLALN